MSREVAAWWTSIACRSSRRIDREFRSLPSVFDSTQDARPPAGASSRGRRGFERPDIRCLASARAETALHRDVTSRQQ